MAKSQSSEIASALEDIRSQIAALSERMARLEQGQVSNGHRASAAPTVAKPAETPPPAAEPDHVTEEELLAISAALAAYFGVRVHIRQIRLVGSRAWAQEGRVSIQASHRL